MEKSASAFFSWASPVLFLGEGCLKWKEQGWQRLWGRPLETLCPQHYIPVAYCPPTFSWEAAIKWSHGCKHYWPGRYPCSLLILTFPERGWDAFCLDFFHKARSKGRRRTFVFLLPSSPLVLSQRPGASQGHRGRRTEAQGGGPGLYTEAPRYVSIMRKTGSRGAELAGSRRRAVWANLPELKGLDSILLTAAPYQNN